MTQELHLPDDVRRRLGEGQVAALRRLPGVVLVGADPDPQTLDAEAQAARDRVSPGGAVAFANWDYYAVRGAALRAGFRGEPDGRVGSLAWFRIPGPPPAAPPEHTEEKGDS